MRRMTYFVMALALVLGFTQCKKEQIEPQTQGEQVRITLNVDNSNNDGSRVNVDPPHVTFEKGDKILVGYGGHYVGTITHDGTSFTGEIDAAVTEPKQKLYFFFVGNKNDVSLSVGNSTCTIDISDQTAELPVLSFSESDQDFNGAGSYTAKLHNQCALVQFTTNEIPVWTAVNISGMKNKVTVNFGSNSITPTGETGNIALHAKDATSRWAILLPQDAVTATATAIEYNPTGSVSVPAINTNDYLTGDDGCSFEMTPDGTFNALHTPLTFEAKTAGATVTFTKAATIDELPIEYSLNGGSWTTYSSPIILANIGDKVSFRGNNDTYATGNDLDINWDTGDDEPQYSRFTFSGGDCYFYGNIMSLISSTGYATATSLPSESYTFCKLFYYASRLYNHPSKTLLLPANTLTSYCYSEMFSDCTNLTTAPALPAMNLADYCYKFIFFGCSNLTTPPSTLPATTMAYWCYFGMFRGCTNLATAPTISATTLADRCFEQMFESCSSLVTPPALIATSTVYRCYDHMFAYCTSLATAPNLSATTLARYCYDSMFYGCTSLTTAPTISATTLNEWCCYNMFNGCTSLTTAPVLHAKTLANDCYYQMFQGCTKLNSVTCLATNISASGCTNNWLKNTAATGTFTKAASMTGWTTGSYSGIPSNWNIVDYSGK